MEELKKQIRTGDILLFNSKSNSILSSFDFLIRCFTKSNYNHIAMVLVNPTFMAKTCNLPEDNFMGHFVWESSWEGTPDPQDGKIKLGVQLTPLEEVINNNKGQVFIRKLECSDELYKKTFTNENLEQIHKIVYDKIYDINPIDWIGALLRKDFKPKKTDRFWCSALIGIIYSELKIILETIDWSIMRPSDFSIEDKNKHIEFNAGFKLSDDQIEFQF
tara:strand:- start:2840 stop:3493 length:654 start_codon:yes stop_codon:yes gene_type:complete